MKVKLFLFVIILNLVSYAQSDLIIIKLSNGTENNYAVSEIKNIAFSGFPTSVDETEKMQSILKSFTLYQNYPNPFNPSTNIMYEIPHYGSVEINIYDIQGQLIRSFGKTFQNAGSYQVTWNGQNNSGAMVSSGTYLCRVSFDETFLVKKLLLIK